MQMSVSEGAQNRTLAFFIKCIGVTLVNKIVWVSSVQFYEHDLYIAFCAHHQTQIIFLSSLISEQIGKKIVSR